MVAEVERLIASALKSGMVPEDGDFGTAEYLPADEIRSIAESLMPDLFVYLIGADITYLWKRKGGAKNNRDSWGQCSKPSGLTSYFAGAPDYVIWIAADHVRDAIANGLIDERGIEALVFHELSHTHWDRDAGKYVVVGHDFEGFNREVTEYGAWRPDLSRLHKTMKQMPLFGGAA